MEPEEPIDVRSWLRLYISPGDLADSNVCQWDCEFVSVENDVLSELILAANYLDIKPLLDLTCTQLTKCCVKGGGYAAGERESAVELLANIIKHAAPAVSALTKCLEHRDRDVRASAASALGQLGEHAAPAVPKLTEYLEHRDDFVRESAASALGKLGEHAAPAVSALAKCLEDREDFVRASAASALGQLGEHAAPAVPQLRKCLEDEDSDVRISAAHALDKIPGHASKRRKLNDDC